MKLPEFKWTNMDSTETDLPHDKATQVYGLEKSVFPLCAAVTNYRTGYLETNKYLFFIVLKAEKPKIKVPADPVPGENLIPGLQMGKPSPRILTLQRAERNQLMSLLTRALTHHEGSTLRA